MEGRLIVENFGPLKKVEIQLNKLMVLIGPQSGGKSTIAKLLAVINESFFYYTGGFHPRRNRPLSSTRKFQDGLEKYNINWDTKDTYINYDNKYFNLTSRHGHTNIEFKSLIREFNPRKTDYLFEEIKELGFRIERLEHRFLAGKILGKWEARDKEIPGFEAHMLLHELNYLTDQLIATNSKNVNSATPQVLFNRIKEINKKAKTYANRVELMEKYLSGNFATEVIGFIKDSISYFHSVFSENEIVYIPAERIFISMASGAFYNLQRNEIPIPQCLIDFGANFETSRNYLKKFKVKALKVTYRYKNGEDLLEIQNKNTIKLNEGSSGYQTLIPLEMVVEYFSKKSEKEKDVNTFIIEEPELNLYPVTQKALVDSLAERCITENNSLLVTTHSPYILSAFANLIKASEVAKISETKKAQIKNIIPEKLWINYEDTSAYFIDKGSSKNIMSKKFRTIDFSKIDKASDVIGDEFDKLLEVEISEE